MVSENTVATALQETEIRKFAKYLIGTTIIRCCHNPKPRPEDPDFDLFIFRMSGPILTIMRIKHYRQHEHRDQISDSRIEGDLILSALYSQFEAWQRKLPEDHVEHPWIQRCPVVAMQKQQENGRPLLVTRDYQESPFADFYPYSHQVLLDYAATFKVKLRAAPRLAKQYAGIQGASRYFEKFLTNLAA